MVQTKPRLAFSSGNTKPLIAAPIRPPITVIDWATLRMRVGASSTP